MHQILRIALMMLDIEDRAIELKHFFNLKFFDFDKVLGKSVINGYFTDAYANLQGNFFITLR